MRAAVDPILPVCPGQQWGEEKGAARQLGSRAGWLLLQRAESTNEIEFRLGSAMSLPAGPDSHDCGIQTASERANRPPESTFYRAGERASEGQAARGGKGENEKEHLSLTVAGRQLARQE